LASDVDFVTRPLARTELAQSYRANGYSHLDAKAKVSATESEGVRACLWLDADAMRAVWITKHGDGRVLAVRETPDPGPGKGEVRVRSAAVGVNFSEVSARQGVYPDAPKPPCVVGYEGSGVIDALGEGTSGHAIGERVMFLSHFGGHADTVVVPADQVLPIPDAMSFEDAAALPVNYVTAYHMLFRVARVRAGDHLLVHMAPGGIGTAVLQLCRSIGGIVTNGTTSPENQDNVRAQGCDQPND
jgi:NADPH:quinone reductase-like Zn-dependent oxidoreductase